MFSKQASRSLPEFINFVGLYYVIYAPDLKGEMTKVKQRKRNSCANIRGLLRSKEELDNVEEDGEGSEDGDGGEGNGAVPDSRDSAAEAHILGLSALASRSRVPLPEL